MEDKKTFTLEVLKEYMRERRADYHAEESAQLVEVAPYSQEKKLSCNMSGIYSELIKQAARCNRYNSDVIYDIQSIDKAMETWTGEKTLFAIGFRRDGVDGNSYIKSRLENDCRNVWDIHKYYFALYFVEIQADAEGYENFRKIICDGYML